MADTSGRRRVLTTVVLAIVLTSLAALVATPARAEGLTRDKLEAHGWSCVVHPFAAPTWYLCFNPGVGRPFPGNPDPAPTYSALVFDIGSGAYVGTAHMIRGDLYAGQPCGSSGSPYGYLPGIGYYDCLRL